MPTIRKNMADINSSDQELNELKIKSDSLPDNWLVTLVNPVTGAVAENMTVARFVELLLKNNDILTKSDEGINGNLAANYSYFLVDRGTIADLNSIENTGRSGVKVYSYPPSSLNTPIKNDNSSILLHIDRGVHGGHRYFSQLAFQSNGLFFKEHHLGLDLGWKQLAFKEDIPLMQTSRANALTETIVEEVPVSANTPMTLQEDVQPTLTMQTVERYEYSVPKMAEAILALQKELEELKGGLPGK